MSEQSQGPGWWLASDGRWYPPQTRPQYQPPPPPPAPPRKGTNPWLVVFAVIGVLAVAGTVGCVALVGYSIDQADEMTGPDTVSVSLRQFEAVEDGMTLPEVEELFGGPGELISQAGSGEFRSEVYTWDGRGSLGSNVVLTFTGGRVMAKAQFGLR